MTSHWDPKKLPGLHGHTVVVTGGNAGLGYFTCEQLSAAGARVIMAARNPERARAAISAIRSVVPGARIDYLELDLANLESVRTAVDRLAAEGPLSALVANAGVIGSAERRTTADGFELQVGTNHLGHFALIAGLLPEFEAAGTRIVHVGSISHRWTRIRPHDLMPERYNNSNAYASSKLAVMSFGFELAERLRLRQSTAQSIVAHPGFALKTFTPPRPGVRLNRHAPFRELIMRPVAHGKDTGAWPLVRAAVDDSVPNGAYCGPHGWFQLKGVPTIVQAKRHARERNTASKLIDVSEELTGVRLPL
ncbi:SDR family NAD(P)-dependent oxidoreductase [Arthrobacter sp. H5]|uniref:SDR family NAD(P)-dependent oxidoreductase n=1 Tax=Arthrobacter sp. H5 TaxID=1267973 RepID=UPI000485758B|nr:SDR family NAD(P)-dependent oxidoreductase [Arthrobacter sp. H5]